MGIPGRLVLIILRGLIYGTYKLETNATLKKNDLTFNIKIILYFCFSYNENL